MALNLQYKVGIKRQIVNALRAVYESPAFPDQELAQKINIELEYPIIQERYPAIYVNWVEKNIMSFGFDNFTIEDVEGIDQLIRHWVFEGMATLNVMTLDPLERDMISASLLDIMAFCKENSVYRPFRERIYNEEWVSLQLNLGIVTPSGDQVAPCPWANKDEFVYISSYGINGIGEFFTEPDSGGLVRIDQVRPYPYRPDQRIPSGSLDSLDISIPWVP